MSAYPSDWQVVPLAKVIRDAAYGVGAPAAPYDHKVKYIRITDIDDASHRFLPSPVVSPAYYEIKHILGENDVLVARTGASVGKSYLYDPADGRLAYAGFLMKFNVVGADARFVFLQTLTQRYADWVASESLRTGQPGLNLGQLKKFEISLPPLDEQKRIAQAIGDMDKLIDNLGQRIAKKKLIKKGAMQELLTGKKRLPGFSGEWVTRTLGSLATMYSGGTPSARNATYYGGGIPWASISDMTGAGKWLGDTEKTLTQEGFDASSARMYPENTLLFAMYASIGKCCIARKSVCSSQAILGLYDLKGVDLEYLYQNLSSREDEFVSMGQVGTQANLSKKIVSKIEVKLPPTIEEQKAISRVLTDMDAEIHNLMEQQAKLKLVKKGMLQDLLTGKVRI